MRGLEKYAEYLNPMVFSLFFQKIKIEDMKGKLILAAVLSAFICVAMVYLLASGKADNINKKEVIEKTVYVEKPAVCPPEPEVPEQPVYDAFTLDSLTRVVNKSYPISKDYVPADLTEVHVDSNGTKYLRKEAAQALEKMFRAAEKDGISLYLISAYRSYEDQEALYNYYTQLYGKEIADSIDCTPGTSEHQLGLSVDLGSADHACELDTCFSQTEAYAWLQAHAREYGYIERNPANGKAETGLDYAPWNFRYVGKDAAEAMGSKTMEAYFFLSAQ